MKTLVVLILIFAGIVAYACHSVEANKGPTAVTMSRTERELARRERAAHNMNVANARAVARAIGMDEDEAEAVVNNLRDERAAN